MKTWGKHVPSVEFCAKLQLFFFVSSPRCCYNPAGRGLTPPLQPRTFDLHLTKQNVQDCSRHIGRDFTTAMQSQTNSRPNHCISHSMTLWPALVRFLVYAWIRPRHRQWQAPPSANRPPPRARAAIQRPRHVTFRWWSLALPQSLGFRCSKVWFG